MILLLYKTFSKNKSKCNVENLGNVEDLEELDVSGIAIRRLFSSIILLKNLKKLSIGGRDSLLSKPSNKLLKFLLLQRSPDPMGMLMRTLSSLSSLRDLNLRYCNLWAPLMLLAVCPL